MLYDYTAATRSDISDLQMFVCSFPDPDKIGEVLTPQQIDNFMALASIINRTAAVMVERLIDVKWEMEEDKRKGQSRSEDAMEAAWKAARSKQTEPGKIIQFAKKTDDTDEK